MIKVSVIMPVYNAEKYLCEALDSLVQQTLDDIEIICVDDGSTDNSYAILKEYAKRNKRFIVLRQQNSFAGVARNYGMSYATGKYLSFLDADDYFREDMLEKAYVCAEKIDADIVVFGGELFVNDIGKARPANFLLREELCPENDIIYPEEQSNFLFNFTNTAPWNKLFRKSYIEEKKLCFQNSKRANDVYFVESALALARKIGILREKLILYRTENQSSLQGTNNDTPMQFVEAFEAVQSQIEKSNLYEKYGKSFRNLCLSNCIYNLESLNCGDAFEKLYLALKNEIFEKFHIVGTKEDEYINLYAYKQYVYIMSHSAVEYWMDKIKKSNVGSCIKKYIFPFGRIEKTSQIILYAAGNVGREFYLQIQKTNYCKILAWVDKSKKHIENRETLLPQQVEWEQCDYVVIAIECEHVAKEIENELIEKYMVSKEKIVWENPIV